MILNITNGDFFDQHFHTIYQEPSIPFREAMMTGTTVPQVFSKEFISHRATALNITETHYLQQISPLLQSIQHSNHLRLWFGEDSFCQLNLLTLLAYLEQEGFEGEITLNLIDDQSLSIIAQDLSVTLGFYQDLYNAILVHHSLAKAQGVISQKAVDLYFDFLSPNGALAKLIKSNPAESDERLLILLMDHSLDYGLSDVQALELIKTHRPPKT